MAEDFLNKWNRKMCKCGITSEAKQKYAKLCTFWKFCDKIDAIRNNIKEVNLMEIKKDMRIGELLEVAPEKAEILLEAGMHCLGCPASQAETLEEACEVHGINVDELIERLNA